MKGTETYDQFDNFIFLASPNDESVSYGSLRKPNVKKILETAVPSSSENNELVFDEAVRKSTELKRDHQINVKPATKTTTSSSSCVWRAGYGRPIPVRQVP